MKNKTILELHQDLLNKQTTVYEINKYYLENLKSVIDRKSNAVLLSFENEVLNQAKLLDQEISENPEILKNNLLFGIPYSLKDNICVKGHLTTGGSLFLKSFVPSYNATVYELLNKKNAILNSKTNLDELGLGGTGLYSGFGDVININNPEYITGGSSSGSALCVQQNTCLFSIATDTGDSIRRPASLLGLVGYKPSYGLISRYGVFPYSPSLDHVGVLTRNISDLIVVLDSIVKEDKKDLTTVNINFDFLNNSNSNHEFKLAIIENLDEIWDNNESKKDFFELIQNLETIKSIQIKKIKLDSELIALISSLYKVISYSEACSSWNNTSGILFGNNHDIEYKNYQDLMFKLRTNYFSKELKKRFVLGSIATNKDNFEKIYLKAKKIIEKIKLLFNDYFKDVDAFLIPSCHTNGILVRDIKNNINIDSQVDDLMQFANFAHLPSITIPYKKHDNLFFGINLFANKYEDQKLINIALFFEQLFNKRI